MMCHYFFSLKLPIINYTVSIYHVWSQQALQSPEILKYEILQSVLSSVSVPPAHKKMHEIEIEVMYLAIVRVVPYPAIH